MDDGIILIIGGIMVVAPIWRPLFIDNSGDGGNSDEDNCWRMHNRENGDGNDNMG